MQVADLGSSDTKISDISLIKTGKPNEDTLTNTSDGLVKRLGDGVNDNTLVIVSSGTLEIDRNLCYGDSCGDDATKLRTYALGTTTKKASTLPQILIFAKNIKIAENVTRVDAWLISEETINTCAGHTVGDLVARDTTSLHFTNGNCGLTLVVNGPIYAKHLDLLRTAGAYNYYERLHSPIDPRDASVGTNGKDVDEYRKGPNSPAEIFNLRADTYIWAFNQAQRYSEAVVTYTRELAPRY
jgi:hypothetical protein